MGSRVTVASKLVAGVVCVGANNANPLVLVWLDGQKVILILVNGSEVRTGDMGS